MAQEANSKSSRPDEQVSERRRQIEEIVIAALELTGARRTAHLDSACGDDRELRR